MEYRGTRLGEILVHLSVIDDLQLAAGLGVQHNWGHPLGQALISLGILDEPTIVRALSLQLGTPSIQLAEVTVPGTLMEMVPFGAALKYRALPLEIVGTSAGDTIIVAMSRPWDLEATDALHFLTGMRLAPVLAGDDDLASALGRVYQGRHQPALRFVGRA